MAPQSRGNNSAGTASRRLQSYSLSSPNLRTLSSSLDPSPSVHQRQNGGFVGSNNDLDDREDDEEGDTDDADFQRQYSLDGGEDSGSDGEDDDGDEEYEEGVEGTRWERQHHRPTFHRSSSDHLPHTLQHNNAFPTNNNPNHHFAPPFYNRPPTPLPPSPSLTSLLRPPFSSSRLTTSPSRPTTSPSRPTTSPSRPTTSSSRPAASPSRPTASSSRLTTPADSSDEDTEARAEEVPRVSPKVPTYEYYGFVLYLVSSVVFLMYLLWSYLPSPFLHALGIYYYPNRWWSLAIPSFLVMSIIYIYVALAAYNTEYLTLPIESIENVVDEVASVAVLGGGGSGCGGGRRGKGKKGKGRKGGEERWRGERMEGKVAWREYWGTGTDAVLDVPVGGVCEVLYGEGREWESDGEGEVVGGQPWEE